MKYPIPNDWDGVTWCNWSVCWPGSPQWEALLRGFLTLPQRGWTWDERTGSVRDTQLIGRQITDENLPLWGCIVSCRDTELSDAIRYLADRLAASRCCTPGVGAGTVNGGTGGSSVEAEEPSEVDDGSPVGDPPAGFETWEQYFGNKCNAANYIVAQWRADLERTQQIGFYAGMTLTLMTRLLGATLLSPIPGDELVLAAATLIAAAGAGAINAVLEALEGVFTDFEQDLICSLYLANTVTSARLGASTVFSDNISSAVPFVEYWANSLTRHWLTNDNLNRLFELPTDVVYPASSCDDCGDITECVLLDFADGETNWFEDYPNAYDDLPAPSVTRDVVPTTTGLQVSASAESGQRVVIVDNEDFAIPIQAGMNIIQHYTNSVSVSSSIRVYLVTNVANRVFYNTHGAGEFTHTNSLTAFAGETIQRIILTVNSNGGNVQVVWHDVEITCV